MQVEVTVYGTLEWRARDLYERILLDGSPNWIQK